MFDGSSFRRRQNVDTVSSSVFDKLTEELLIEILIRLPQKPANICKCISLRFRSLISNSSIRTSSIIDLAFGSPIFESAGFSLSFLSCPEQEKQEGSIKYVASNNGLVLCCADICPPVVYIVCNPLTKQWISLPPPPSHVKKPYAGFIYNPQYSCNNDHEQGMTSFKVVQIEVADAKSPSITLKLEIFCSVSGRWTKECYKPSSTLGQGQELLYRRHRSAVVCGGLLHWFDLFNRAIFIYDPYSCKCTSVELPCEIDRSRLPVGYCLGECAGRLRYCNFSMDGNNYQVWELKDYNINGNAGEWLLLHKVHLDEMKSTLYTGSLSVLPPHPLNKDIVFFWCASSGRILEYSMRNKILSFLRDAKISDNMYHKFFPFVLPCWPTTIPLIPQHGLN